MTYGLRNANYTKAKKLDLWDVSEGICFLLGVEPIKHLLIHKGEYGYGSPRFWTDFDEIAKLVCASIERQILRVYSHRPNFHYCKIVPSIFLKWAQDKGLTIHEELTELLNEMNRNDEEKEVVQQVLEKVQTKKLSSNQVDKLVCQGIARTLWAIYPTMTAKDVKNHNAIQQFGNARLYTGHDTVLGWLREVDLRSPSEKTGRPPLKKIIPVKE